MVKTDFEGEDVGSVLKFIEGFELGADVLCLLGLNDIEALGEGLGNFEGAGLTVGGLTQMSFPYISEGNPPVHPPTL